MNFAVGIGKIIIGKRFGHFIKGVRGKFFKIKGPVPQDFSRSFGLKILSSQVHTALYGQGDLRTLLADVQNHEQQIRILKRAWQHSLWDVLMTPQNHVSKLVYHLQSQCHKANADYFMPKAIFQHKS